MSLTPAPHAGIRMTPEGEPMPTVSELVEEVTDEVREQVVDDRGVKPSVLIPVGLMGVLALSAVVIWAVRNR